MEYIANFMSVEAQPAAWARQRESEGWDVLGCADHFWSSNRPFPHVWVTLATMAASTTSAKLTSSFANNLFRSPVEFAQAALQMHAVSDGRFEAGLGAGWSKAEAIGAGIGYPTPGERAGRYIEAVTIVREMLHRGACTFKGQYYDIDVPAMGPRPTGTPPPLVASLGGDRTIREIAPLVDRVELKMISTATRNGELDLAKLATIPADHLRGLVDKVRAVNETVPLGVFVLCGIGDNPMTKQVSSLLGDSFIGGFFGEPGKVANSLRALADFGIERVQLSPFADTGFELLAKELFS